MFHYGLKSYTFEIQNFIVATYSIAEVEHLTGIQAHTLRIWERRYGLIKAQRTDTKIRFYDDRQLKLLLNVSILLKNGYRVSAIDKMQVAEIEEVTERLLTQEVADVGKDVHQGLTKSMLAFDEPLFVKIFESHRTRHGLKSTAVDLLYPFLHHVGVLWSTNRSMPAQEHFISNLIRRKLFSAIENLPDPKEEARKLVLFLVEGDYHEIGLLLSYYLAREAGFRVYYLGQNVPCEDVLSTCAMVDAHYAMTIVLHSRPSYESQIKKICEGKAKVIVAGNLRKEKKFTHLNSPQDFINFLNGNLKLDHPV